MPNAPEALIRMLNRYDLKSVADYKNAIKEIIQEIALLGLWRANFFEKAAFYGGTALRILHQLDRFSEDLDFSLLQPDPTFDMAHYEKAILEELQSLGMSASIEKKKKTKETAIQSAFIKMNTIQHLLLIGIPAGIYKGIHPGELLKIRLEVDTDPPLSEEISTETRFLLLPYPFSIKTFRLEDLFAGKMHAALCREWKGRVKGRDWYDLIWFISKNIALNMPYLEARMRQSGHWMASKRLQQTDLLDLFDKRVDSLDIPAAKEDIIAFIKDPLHVEVWSKDFFKQLARRIALVT